MIQIISSKKDIAGLNITKQLLQHYPFKETINSTKENPEYSLHLSRKNVLLKIINQETIETQNLLQDFKNPTLIVFISRHCSSSCKPTFSVHTPGNLYLAKMGGLPKKVSVSPGLAMKNALRALAYFRDGLKLDFDVSYECTHHGPSYNVPTMFVELGSSQNQWCNSKAAEVVGHAAISAISKYHSSNENAVLGIGGTHYNQKFSNLAINSEIIFSHIIPKYLIQYLDSNMLSQCVEKTVETVESALLDWKGIKSSDKPQLLKKLKDINLPYNKI